MIEFKNVSFKYLETQDYVLKDINLAIREGEVVSIVGDNGSGKTTLVKHMNGLLKPVKGEVYVDGVNTRDAPVSELARKVALVYQYPERMFFNPTVKEEISSTLVNFGIEGDLNDEIVENILRRFGLYRYRDRSPFSLSGGEQRRLSIAIAISWNPKYLILDEPTIGLDGDARKELVKTIYELIESDKTVILVTHDMNFILEFDSRVILLNKGVIIFDGPLKKFMDEIPIHEYGLSKPGVIDLIKKLNIQFPSVKYSTVLEEISRRMRC